MDRSVMMRIAISVEAFEAIAATLPLGPVGYNAEANERGERYVSLTPRRTLATVSYGCSELSLAFSPCRPCWYATPLRTIATGLF